MIQNLSFNLFGNFENLDATPERISKLLVSMLNKGLQVVPGTFQQINPEFGMKKFDRMQFFNQKENFTVFFNVDSIRITTNIVNDKPYNLEKNLRIFLSKINKFFSSLDSLEETIPEGKRVALIVSVLHDADKIKPLDDIYIEFSNKLPTYGQEETFEWNNRAVKRSKVDIHEYSEFLNIVSEVIRTQGKVDMNGELVEFDTINTVMDINTLNDNQNERINSQFVKIFMERAVDIFFENYKPIEVKLNGNNS